MKERKIKKEVLIGYRDYIGKRYESFSIIFNHISLRPQNIIVELGTTRSFVDLQYRGCRSADPIFWNENDPSIWDWGAGVFTRVAAEVIFQTENMLYTVDPSPEAISISKKITEPFLNNVEHCAVSSTNFLSNIEGEIDVIYMDHHETSEEGALLHLQDAKIILEKRLLTDNALVLIDDVHIDVQSINGAITQPQPLGKGKYSIPFFEQNGYERIYNGYQVILKKSLI
jgi:hypothetical protein